ncbi:hypothetical protein DFJ73DRAFT_888711, partial [Zopfochytrium polystomum]
AVLCFSLLPFDSLPGTSFLPLDMFLLFHIRAAAAVADAAAFDGGGGWCRAHPPASGALDSAAIAIAAPRLAIPPHGMRSPRQARENSSSEMRAAGLARNPPLGAAPRAGAPVRPRSSPQAYAWDAIPPPVAQETSSTGMRR